MRGAQIAVVIAVLAAVGCGKTDAPPVAEGTAASAAAAPAKKLHPAARAATSFLVATANGQMKTAEGLLTPLANEQLHKGGQCLMPLSVDSPQFHVTRLLMPQADEAAVEFRMQFQAQGQAQQFDGCCFMKNVGGAWRLAGIALDPGNGSAPILQDYESKVPAGPAEQNPVGTVSSPQHSSQIPHTAQSAESTQVR